MKQHEMRSAVLYFILFLAALVFGVLVFAAPDNGDRSSPVMGATTTGSPVSAPTAWYDNPLLSPAEREFYRHLPPDKQVIAQRDFEARLRALSSTPVPGATKSMPTMDPRTTPYYPDIGRAAGAGRLIEGGLSPFCGTCFVLENVWYETVAGKMIAVYAGALPDNPGASSRPASQGMVMIIGEAGYPTTTRVGPVRIIDAQGERLILKAEDGTTLYFDVPGRRFVSSLTEPVPTVSPTPVPQFTPTIKPYP